MGDHGESSSFAMAGRRSAFIIVLICSFLDCGAGAEAEEPEHLHDPPFLKHIPHLWPGTVGQCGSSTEKNTFYDGDDLAWRTNVATARDCQRLCAQEKQCNGWSHFAPAKRCYIKSSLTGTRVDFGGTESGLKPCGSQARGH